MNVEQFDSHPEQSSRDTSAEAPQVNERGPDQYEYYLGILPNGLSGKRVLNIGSGRTGMFEKAVAQNNGEVFTISPHFADEGGGGKRMRAEYKRKPILNEVRRRLSLKGAQRDMYPVASRVEQGIPFASDSMDYVFALYSVPLYLDTPEGREILFSEIDRVLREKGKAVLYPIPESQKAIFSDTLEQRRLGFSFIEIPELENPVYPGEKSYRLEITK